MNGWVVVLQLGLLNGLILFWAVAGFSIAFRLFSFADLTVEASVPLGAGVFAVWVQHGHSPWTGALLGMIAGGSAGAVTAVFHVWLRVNKLLAGVIVVAVAYSATLAIMQAPNIGLLRSTSLFGASIESRVTVLSLLATLLAVPCIVIWLSSRTGLRMRAAGGNPDFAASLGISPRIYVVLAIAATNALAALSGILLASYQGFADVGMGDDILIMALASLGIGEAVVLLRRLPSHVAVVLAALVGSIGYQIILATALRLGLPAVYLQLSAGILVLVVVAIQAVRSPRPLWREVLD